MSILKSLWGDGSIISQVKSSAARKRDAETRLNFYYDKQIEDLRALIAASWKGGAESFRLFFVNVVRKVINRRTTLYQKAPFREVQGWNQDKVETLYRSINANVVLKKATRLTKLCKTAMLQVGFDEQGQRPTLAVLTPNVLDIEYVDPARPTRVVVTHPAAKESDVTYSVWTETTFSRHDFRGFKIANPNNPEDVNPYGVLPFVPLFDREPDGDFFLTGGDDLIEAQRAINVGLANLWRTIEWQSHGQPWVKGVDSTSGPVNLGPQTMIHLPEGGDFGFAVPGNKISETISAIEFLIKQTAVANDLAANVFEIDSKAESGAAKQFETRDLLEARADDIDLWREYETRLFEVIKRVLNTHKPGTIPENATFYMDFADVGDTQSPTERIQSYQSRIDMGIWSPVDALMADNPDFRTRESALEELNRRRDETAALGLTAFSGPSFTQKENNNE